MIRIFRPAPALAALALLSLAGCESFGNPIEVLKLKKPAPDEFQVLARKELMMPPGLGGPSLPTPQPGLASPLEPDPQGDAIAALGLGSAAEPGNVTLSRGESALLDAAGAGATPPDIREALTRENAELEANAPYELPSVFDLFGSDPKLDPTLVLDATAESQRLQNAGVPAPVDPTAQAAVEAPRVNDDTISFYPPGAFGKPTRNTFTTPNVVPPGQTPVPE